MINWLAMLLRWKRARIDLILVEFVEMSNLIVSGICVVRQAVTGQAQDHLVD